jgi:hypothetical protein
VPVWVQVWFAQQGCVAPPQIWQVPATHTIDVGPPVGLQGTSGAPQQGWFGPPQA